MTAITATRERELRTLEERTFDVVIIGGGITGAGIARDAALRNLSVALIDKDDFASGTSSKSTKLVHGGLRYLEQGHVGLVFESVRERAILRRIAPHLVRPLEFLVPSYRGNRPGMFVMDCGVWLYEALSGFTSPHLHRTRRRGYITELEPGLRREGLRGGTLYWDCATDDARLTLENILDARALGVVALNHVRATRFLMEGERFVGVEAEDTHGGAGPIAVRGKVVVNATGPWCDELRHLYGAPEILSPTKGVHIVVDHARLPVGRALLVREAKRVVFCIPWGARTVVGTTDTFYRGAPEDADVDYLLEVGNHYFPGAKLAIDDVLATWSGLRPLLRPPTDAAASAVSREHHLESRAGLVTIAGGKLTTYRRMAAEVVDRVCEQFDAKPQASRTAERALPGGEGVVGDAGVAAIGTGLATRGGFPGDVAEHIARTYGARAASIEARVHASPGLDRRICDELPFIEAEIDEAIEVEMATSLSDILERRVPLSLLARDQGLRAATQVTQRAAEKLGWSDADAARELAAYEHAIAQTRRFRA
jgi:glycerol-3-phosphate dehydrogenase